MLLCYWLLFVCRYLLLKFDLICVFVVFFMPMHEREHEIHTRQSVNAAYMCVYIHIHICVYICIYVYIHICISCVYIYI